MTFISSRARNTLFSEPVRNEHSQFAALPREMGTFVEQVCSGRFPIDSKRDLLEQLGGPETPIFLADTVVLAEQALMFLPANMFPLASPANFVEKLAEYFATRAGVPLVDNRSPEQTMELAKRFVTENPELVTQLGLVVRDLASKAPSEGTDDDVVAQSFFKKHRRFVESLIVALRDSRLLAQKAFEKMDADVEPTVVSDPSLPTQDSADDVPTDPEPPPQIS